MLPSGIHERWSRPAVCTRVAVSHHGEGDNSEAMGMPTPVETPRQTSSVTRLQAKSLEPSLTVDDLQQSIRFYEGLGFDVEDRWEDNGVLLGVMLKAGEARIGISQDDGKKGRDRRKGVGMRIYISTAQDLEGLASGAKKAGITLDAEPHDTPWGSRAFDVTDPSGFKLTIASNR